MRSAIFAHHLSLCYAHFEACPGVGISTRQVRREAGNQDQTRRIEKLPARLNTNVLLKILRFIKSLTGYPIAGRSLDVYLALEYSRAISIILNKESPQFKESRLWRAGLRFA